jgi:DNA replication protein DnaC
MNAEPPPIDPTDGGTPLTRPCTTCGAPIPYEPLMVGERDFGKLLSRYCAPCEKAAAVADNQRAAEEREQLALERIRSIIPPDLRGTLVTHPDFDRALWRVVDEWGPGTDGRWMGIVGPAGRCKTRCLALKANRFIRNGQRVAWTTATYLQTASEDRSSRRHDLAAIAQAHLRDCMVAAVLIIDDLGKNTWTPTFERHFFELINHRRNHLLPILWSSNVHPEQFSQVISTVNAMPIIGRLLDRCDVLEVD